MSKIDPVILRTFFGLRSAAAGAGAYQPGRERYIVKSLDGGTGWGVYDRQSERFLKDPEVAALGLDLINANLPSN